MENEEDLSIMDLLLEIMASGKEIKEEYKIECEREDIFTFYGCPAGMNPISEEQKIVNVSKLSSNKEMR